MSVLSSLGAVVLVGAEAIYLQTGDANLSADTDTTAASMTALTSVLLAVL